MELEAATFMKSAYFKDDRVVSLFADGLSLIISRWVKLQVIVAHSQYHDTGMTEYLRLTCGKVKNEVVEKMAADILALFVQPEEHYSLYFHHETKERCPVENLQFLLHELMRLTFRYTIGRNASMLKTVDILFKLYEDFLQEKYDSVEELRRTLS